MPPVPDLHSVWLLAEAATESRLAASVRDLAARFASPPFHPHLTLAGDIEAERSVLERAIEDVADLCPACDGTVTSVETGATFYRAFFLKLSCPEALDAARERISSAARTGAGSPFIPHVSLAYGVPATPDRSRAQAEIAAAWAGTAIRFDRIALVRSADTIPIADWTVLRTWPLRATP